MRKIDVIIDTDPGVDDSIANIMAFFEKRLNILLFSTVSGNKDVNTCTRNILYLQEYFDKSFPTAKGAANPLTRTAKDASFIHQQTGLGNHIPWEPKKLQVLKEDAADAMYEIIRKNKKKVVLLLLGPQTNAATLFNRHPDIENKISKIIFMGASSYGENGVKPYISFNISSDPEAFHRVMQTKIPLVMAPSEIGRAAYLTEEEVYSIQTNQVVGKIMFEMLDGYWEPGHYDKRVAMNDSCALFYLLHPKLFVTRMADVDLNLTDRPGKTIFNYRKNGRVKIIRKLRKKAFVRIFFKTLKRIEKYNDFLKKH